MSREVLFAARHRCAVCCDPLPLQRAHIVPWHKTHDHSAENLIALCANCHARADHENWGEAVLRRYRKEPCALAANSFPLLTPEQKALVDLIINLDPDAVTPRQQGRIVAMVAAYVGFPLAAVRIESIEEANSTRVRLSLPRGAAHRLVYGWAAHDPLLVEMLDDLPLLRVERAEAPTSSTSSPPAIATGGAAGRARNHEMVATATTSRVGGVTICTLTGPLGMHEESLTQVTQALQRLVADSARPAILLDLTAVESMTSAGLAVLITLQRSVAEKKGKLVLVGIAPEIMEVFVITKMDRLFLIREDRTAALKALGLNPPT